MMNEIGGDGLASVFKKLVSAVLIALMVLPQCVMAAPPAWWSDRGIIQKDASDQPAPMDDYAAVNQGQLKNIAAAAKGELDTYVANGGSGPVLDAFVSSWAESQQGDDYAAVNIGQLKALATPFYDRLIEIGYSTAYPWSDSSTPANDYAVANIGQVKSLFSFDLAKDTDGDGIPDWWEIKYGLDPNDPADGTGNLDSDDLTNLDEFRGGTNPNEIDTDQDGIPDGWEVSHGLDPLDPTDAGEDSGEGQTYLDEYYSELAPPPIGSIVELWMTAGRAGHCFSLERDGGSEMISFGSLIEQIDGTASTKVTITIDPKRYADYKLVDQTTGDYVSLENITVSTSFTEVQWISLEAGNPSTRRSFVLTPDRANHQFAIYNATGTFSPVTLSAFSGTIVQNESAPPPPTPTQRIEAAGQFVPDQSFQIVDLTTGESSSPDNASVLSEDFSAANVAVPLRQVTIIVPSTDAGKSFSLSCRSSAAWYSAQWKWINGQFHAAVTGTVAAGAQFTLQRPSDWTAGTSTLAPADDDLVDFRSTITPQSNPTAPADLQTIWFTAGNDHSGMRIRRADGTFITPTVVDLGSLGGNNGEGQQISPYEFTIYEAQVDLSQNYTIEDQGGSTTFLTAFSAPPPSLGAPGFARFLVGENHTGIKVLTPGGVEVPYTVIGDGYLTASRNAAEYYRYNYSVCEANVGVGQTYDVVDRDGRTNLMDGFNPPAPTGSVSPVTHNFQKVWVRVGEDSYGHAIIQLGNGSTIVPAVDLTKEGAVTVFDSNGDVSPPNATADDAYSFVLYSATVDVNLGYTIENDLGGSVLFNPPIAPLPPDSGSGPPAGAVAIYLASDRADHTIRFRQVGYEAQSLSGDGVEQAHNISGYIFPGNGEEKLEDQWVGYTRYWVTPSDPALGFSIIDETQGDSITFSPGTAAVDLRVWLSAKQPLQLNVAASRWTHTLEIHTANGDIVPLQKGRMQGFWSPFDTSGPSSFKPSWYFDAVGYFRPGLDWWIFDVDTGERSGENQNDLSQWATADANTDTDLDGLPDWYERVIATNPAIPDGQGVDDTPDDDSGVGGPTGPLPDNATVIYTYNNLNQLKTAKRYEGWDVAPGQAPLSTVEYRYDLNGNRTKYLREGYLPTEYSYDLENRLKKVAYGTAEPAQEAQYGYDYRTRRVLRTEGGTTTKIVFSGGTSIQEYGAGSTPEVQHVRGSDMGGGVGGHLYSLRDSGPSFTRYDARGDVVGKTDATGGVTYRAAYDAFGTRSQEAGTTADRQRANTKDEDPTGLLNEGFRYRDLETGTFITRDPAGFVDGPNLYAYVGQNPWSRFDADGLYEQSVSDYAELGDALIYVGGKVIQGSLAVPKALFGWAFKSPGSDEQAQAIENTFKSLASLPGSDPSVTSEHEVEAVKQMFTTPEGLSSLGTAALIAKFGPKIFEDTNAVPQASGLDAISLMKERRLAFDKEFKREFGGVEALGMGDKVVRYTDPISTLSLKDLSLNTGMKKLLALGLGFKRLKGGRVIFFDMKTNQERVHWDGDHWDKFAPGAGGTRLDNSGRIVNPSDTAAHIPSTGESTGQRLRRIEEREKKEK